MPAPAQSPRWRRPWVAWTALAALCVVVVALWAPFGLRATAWVDAWSYYGALLNGETLAPLLNSRPLNWLPYELGYGLISTSFMGINLLIAWFILLKGVLVYAIVRLLAPGATGLALATALLAMVYPAEVGYFFDGYHNLHQGFDLYLLALFLLLAFWKRGSRVLLGAAIVALALSVFTYEAVLALAVATPLLLVWLERRVNRRLVLTSVLWWSPVVVYLLFIVALRASVGLNEREAGLLSSGLSVPNLPLEVLNANLWNLGQHYLQAWRWAFLLSPFSAGSPLFLIAAMTGLLVGLLFLLHTRLARRTERPGAARVWPARRWLELFALSILWTVLGYAVFSVASVRYDGWRLSFYTVLGSSLTIALLVYGATAHRRTGWLLAVACAGLALAALVSGAPIGWVALAAVAAAGFALPRPVNFSVLIGVLLTVSVVRQLDLHRWQTGEALTTQRVLATITEVAPGLEEGAALVLVTDSARSDSDVPFAASSHLDRALDLIHRNPGHVGFVCPLGLLDWGYESEACWFGPDGIVLERKGVERVVPYERLVVVALGEERSVRLVESLPPAWGAPPDAAYDPGAHLNPGAPTPAALEALFNPRPLIDR